MHYLVKMGELMLKKGNRRSFEQALRRDIRKRLPHCEVYSRNGRCYIDSQHEDTVECEAYYRERLATLPGITGFARVSSCAKDDAAIATMVRQLSREQVAQYGDSSSFRAQVRRTDKSLARTSQDYAAWLGSLVLEQFPKLRVQMQQPDWSMKLELREKAYLYCEESKGEGGLPCGTSGQGLLLLSGGIDSPVAGYLLACRGMQLEAAYFDTPPFTSDAAFDKVRRLAARLARWTCSNPRTVKRYYPEEKMEINLLLHRIPFTELQLALRKHVSPGALTLQSRACMVLLAERLAANETRALLSGEALSQVASQTIQNLGYTNSFAELPVLRPLIGFDKEQIIALSRRIGCFDISIEPHVDCCTYFAPEHPLTRAVSAELQEELAGVPRLEELFQQTLERVETCLIGPQWQNPET